NADGPLRIQARLGEESVSVITDDVGRFEIHDLVPGTYEVLAVSTTDRGLYEPISTPVSVTVATKPVTLDLVTHPEDGVIHGRVVDESGQPIDDAFITVARERDEAPAITYTRQDDQESLAVAGTFSVRHLGKTKYTVRASRKTGGEAIAAHVSPGSDISLVIAPTGGITGTARNAADELHADVYEDSHRIRSEVFFHTAGRFVVPELPAGTYQIILESEGVEKTVTVEVSAGKQTSVDVELARMVTLVGHVVESRTKQPVAGILMYAQRDNLDTSYTSPADNRNQSDASGRFEIPYMPRGELELFGRTIEDHGTLLATIGAKRSITVTDPDVIDVGTVYVTTEAKSAMLGNYGCHVAADGVVTDVAPDGPAARAGIVDGNVITAIDGIPIHGVEVARLLSGDPGVTHEVTLEGRNVSLTLTQ
ncbi:MAG TPA: PDZ domain-containing protein, partial [Kofleriaceae bacterium]